MGSATFTDVRG